MSLRTTAVQRLEDAILDDRDDVELYLVYADELQRRGDPRGELVVMQNQIQQVENKRARQQLQKTCDAWIEQHDLLGPLRGFAPIGRGRSADVTWRYGFIRCLEIGWGVDAADTPVQARETLEAILTHPSSPFITVLVLGPAPAAPGRRRRMDMQCLVDAIAATGCPKALRSLHLGRLTEWPVEQTATGNIGEASAALQRLQKLSLEAGTVRVGALALPALLELRILCGELDQDLLAELYAIQCPKLETLTISFDHAPAAPDTLEKRLRARLPHVRKVRARTARR